MYILPLKPLLALIIVIALLGGCAKKQSGEQISETRLLLDTFCTITIHGDVDQRLLDEAFEICEEYEKLLSITIEGSDIWRINNAGGEPVTVDPRTIEVIEAGLEFAKITDGMFDITIGRLSRLWDFGATEEVKVPSEPEIKTASATIDYTKVKIEGETVQLVDPDAWIDLGGIAKGFIGDRIAEHLMLRGAAGALINLGGDIITAGNRQDGKPWRIALRDPFGEAEDRLGVFEISGLSVISSGTYERKFEKDGVTYHHILDPHTGYPVVSDIVSATVVSGNGMVGEGLATAAVLMGSARAREMFEKTPGFIGAALVLENGELQRIGDARLSS